MIEVQPKLSEVLGSSARNGKGEEGRMHGASPGCFQCFQAMEAFAVLEKLALDFATQASVRHFEASPSEGDDFTHIAF